MFKKVPQYRLQGYTDAWELRKLGEVAKYRNGKAHEQSIVAEGDYVVINSKFVSTGGVVEKFSSRQLEPLYKNEITFVLSDIPNGKALSKTFLVDVDQKYTLNQRIAAITPKESASFLNELLNRNSYFLKFDNGVGQTNLAKDQVLEFNAFFPSLPEQEAIGTFFSTLDQHITLHQRKLDTLKEQKKTYLKLLFPSKGQTKPALRFQGFEDDWEEVKLGEVLSVSKLKNKENEYSKLNVLSVSREQGTVNQIEYQGRSFASDDVSGYKIVNVGQMIYTKSPLKGAPYGIFQTVTINGIVSPLYAVYNSSGRALASFVSLILKEDAIATHYLSPLVTKGAKNTINVTDEGALEGKVKIPTLPEQQAIGTFFQTLDREISQVEDKLASLKELKKTLLRKLFV